MDTLKWLQKWYLSNCDGDWEHMFGIMIETLDNPGWRVDISLIDTELELREFVPIKKETTENNWVHCWINDGKFKGAGGPENLEEILITFRKWVEQED